MASCVADGHHWSGLDSQGSGPTANVSEQRQPKADGRWLLCCQQARVRAFSATHVALVRVIMASYAVSVCVVLERDAPDWYRGLASAAIAAVEQQHVVDGTRCVVLGRRY